MSDDIAQRLASLRHYFGKFTLVGSGLNVQGSVRDGFILSRATDNDVGAAALEEPPSCPIGDIEITFFGVVLCADCFGRGRSIVDVSLNGTFTLPRTFVEGSACLWQGNGGDFHRTIYDDPDCTTGAASEDFDRTGVIVVENLSYEGIPPGGWSITYGDDSNLDGWFSTIVPNLSGTISNGMLSCTGTNGGNGFTYDVGYGGTVTINFI